MPELPEVQTVVDELKLSLVGKSFSEVQCLRANIRYPIPDLSVIEGKQIAEVSRRAKYIIISFQALKLEQNPSLTLPSGEGIGGVLLSGEGTSATPLPEGATQKTPLPEGGVGGGFPDDLVLHLGMSGKIMIGQPQERIKHDHVVFGINDGQEMVFNDARRFGIITLGGEQFLDHLGPEPLSDVFDGEYLFEQLSKKSAPVKNVIMDQRIVVGVGNIYASESLFRSGIRPTRAANKVKRKECGVLAENIKDVLNEAIASGGSTLRDYVRSSGDLGYFQHSHAVYGKEGQACVSCKSEIIKVTQAGRSSFYCTTCQS